MIDSVGGMESFHCVSMASSTGQSLEYSKLKTFQGILRHLWERDIVFTHKQELCFVISRWQNSSRPTTRALSWRDMTRCRFLLVLLPLTTNVAANAPPGTGGAHVKTPEVLECRAQNAIAQGLAFNWGDWHFGSCPQKKKHGTKFSCGRTLQMHYLGICHVYWTAGKTPSVPWS